MSRKKDPRRHTPRKETPPPVAVFRFSEMYRRLLTALFPLIAVVSGLYYTLPMEALIEETGLPLDAGYIPLVFARSLLEYGAYSFHATDMITSGALAPLQVLLLAGIGLFTSDGITASFVLGIASFAVTAVLTFRLGLLLFPDRQWLAACAALVIALAPRLGSAAVAGVPTMLFTALILASATAYFGRRSMLFFLFAALALWVRPDALLFLLAAILHLLYNHLAVAARNKPESVPGSAVTGRQTGIGALLFLLLAAGYAVFNAALGTGVFPLPFVSELAYYSGSIGAFLSEVLRFFTFSWSGVLLLFTLLAVVYLVVDLVRRRPLPVLMSAAVLLIVIIGYALLHPVMRTPHVLLPVLPFFVLFSSWGMLRLADQLAAVFPGKTLRSASVAVIGVLFIVMAGMQIAEWSAQRSAHYAAVKYLRDRHVAMGKWIAENTAGDALIATHVPGAVGYHGKRALIDMKGSVSPEVLPLIGDLPGLIALFDEKRVKYVAAIRDEFEVVNVNPLVTSDLTAPGVAEVFPYIPTRTHIMSQRASALNVQAAALLKQEETDAAARLLGESLAEDPLSSRTGTLLGLTLLQMEDTSSAISAFRKALELHPQYAPAMVPLGDLLVKQKKFWEGLRILNRAVTLNPQSAVAKKSLENAEEAQRADSLGERRTFSITLTQ